MIHTGPFYCIYFVVLTECQFNTTYCPEMSKKIILFFLFAIGVVSSNGQIKGYEQNIVTSKDTSLIKSFFKLFKGKPNPLIDSTNISISRFMLAVSKMEGKRINSIHIEQRHFGATLTSDKSIIKDPLTRLADKLHNNTNNKIIQKNLFIKEGEILNPMIIAYNEKWLRDLPFIQDARIVAYPLSSDTNSVDLFVITKDIFPFGASFNMKSAKAYDASISSENMNDKGNSFSINNSYDYARSTKTGMGAFYIARNILGSFIDLNVGGKTFENNYSNGASSASYVYVKGERQLLNPMSRWSGGLELSISKNKNVFPSKWSDSLYKTTLDYNLKRFDVWAGYQLFNTPDQYSKNNPRHFIQYRFFHNDFLSRPVNYLEQVDKDYQNLIGHIVSYTVIQQKIIRTQYLYGFGRNEDLPSGKSITFTAGHFTREKERLPYAGIQFENYSLSNSEDFRHLNLSIGSCYLDKKLQDIRLLASLEDISKIHYLTSGYRYRRIINLSFTETLNNKYNEALLINSLYGIPQLTKERIRGGTRISANWESIWYNSRAFYGFRSAPFAFANLTYMRTIGASIKSGDIYSAIGSGIRVRNENLIFGTMELKGFYFPRTNLQLSPWNISFSTNLRFKYNSKIISKPDFVQIN